MLLRQGFAARVHHDEPADLSIDDRLEELAALLAAGFLRLKCRTGITAGSHRPRAAVSAVMADCTDSSKRRPHRNAPRLSVPRS